ncbi:MAG: hypothetical protein V7L09_05280 [Nostoc sp.]|uniref:hypothetical protein n=1 Tax=Nostoc sp. TaxID=1180 RepID=UPI002FF1E036
MIAQRKAFSSLSETLTRTTGNAFGMASLREAAPTLRASPQASEYRVEVPQYSASRLSPIQT